MKMPSAPSIMSMFGKPTDGASDEVEVQGRKSKRKMSPEEKAAEIKFGCDRGAYKDCEYRDDLQKQLAGSFHFSGEWGWDLWFFICNWHPLIGMFCSHPAHPWAKRERIFAFLVSTAFTLFCTSLYVNAGMDNSWVLLGVVTVPVMIFEIAFYWLSIGDVFCQGGWFHCCTYAVQAVKYTCCLFTVIFVAAFVGLSFVLLDEKSLKKVAEPFVLSRTQSWVIWFPLWVFLPYMGFVSFWRSESKAMSMKLQDTQ